MEKTPRYSVLGRKTACSTKRIEVLSNKMQRNHALRYTPSVLYLKSCCDGIWRNHLRESICVTSTTSHDFLQRYLDERIGFRSRWKQQGHPTNPTKTKNLIIKNGETRGYSSPRRSRKMSCLVAKAPNTQQERGDLWMDQNPSRVACQCL